MKESRVEDHLIKRVGETGGITRKIIWPGRRGAPDRLVGWPRIWGLPKFGVTSLRPAKHFLVEMKRPLTPDAEDHQKREHDRLRSIGFDVRVLATIEEVDDFIEEMTR